MSKVPEQTGQGPRRLTRLHNARLLTAGLAALLAGTALSACSSSSGGGSSSGGSTTPTTAVPGTSSSAQAGSSSGSASTPAIGNGSGSGPAVAKAKKHYNMVLITGDNHDPFFVTMNAGAQAEAKALGVSVKWEGPAQYQPSLQIPIVNAVIASKPDFVFVCPTDAQALGAPIKQLMSDGIPVMTLDSDVNDKTARLGNITSDNLLGGKEAADTLAKMLNGTGEVAVLNEQPGVTTTDLRQQGFEQELKKYPNIKYVGVARDNDDPNAAATAASGLLTRYPNLSGIFGTDTANGAGAAIAAQQAGRTIRIVAFDAEPEEVTALKQGHINALIVQKAYDFGVLAVKYAVAYLNGDHSAIPPETQMDYVIATKDNIDSPEVQKYLYLQQ